MNEHEDSREEVMKKIAGSNNKQTKDQPKRLICKNIIINKICDTQ
jgi:hypothetical protein